MFACRGLLLFTMGIALGCGGSAGAPDVVDPMDSGDEVIASTAVKAFPSDFRFGAATAAHQIEGGQTNNWSLWETLPQFAGKTAEPSSLSTDHYNRYEEDLDWITWMGLDTFRLSVEWSRIEPARGVYDPKEVAHYRDVFEAMKVRGIRPSVTLHHFTEPTWFNDLTKLSEPPTNDGFCPDGPSDTDLCFWSGPDAPKAFGDFCGKVAREYGAWVDEWMTINELTGYWLSSSIGGDFPPGLTAMTLPEIDSVALPVLRGMLEGHALCYRAIHDEDTVDADGDGRAAVVGMTMGVGSVRPSDPEDPAAVEAAEQGESLANYLVFDAVTAGMLDADFDTVPEESHPEWADTLDIIGVQYYASTVVVPLSVHPVLKGTPCMNVADETLVELELLAGCPPPPTYDFTMGDEIPAAVYGRQPDPDGLVEVLGRLHDRYPDVGLVITENGFANYDQKRAGTLVRHLDACHRAIEKGIPLEGYYHWSLLDNYEWGSGFAVRFGLIRVDYDNGQARMKTVAADVYRDITASGGLTQDLLDIYGGNGPLLDEAGVLDDRLTVTTFNVLHGLLSEDPAAQPFDRFAERLDLTAGSLAADQDSLVLLQEVSATAPEGYPDVIRDFLDAMNEPGPARYHAAFGALSGDPPTVDSGEGYTGQLIGTRLPLVTVPHGTSVASLRSVTHLRVDSGLGLVDAFNCHLDGGSHVEALEEMQKVLDFVDAQAGEDTVVILAGDFNSTPDSPVFDLLRAAGFEDLGQASGLTCGQAGDPGCTIETLPLADPANPSDRRIDYVWMRTTQPLETACVSRFQEALPDGKGGSLWMSDHIGIRCEISKDGVGTNGPLSEPCNGHSSLCGRRYDEVSSVTTHNAMANEAQGFAIPNQLESLTTQMTDGVRGLMLDTHYYQDEVTLCHSDCLVGHRPLLDGLVEIREFLQANPREIITIIFESQVSESDTAAVFEAAGLTDFLLAHWAGDPWPTLGLMIETGRRLVVFSDKSKGKVPWHHDVWDHCWETHWSNQDLVDFDCEPNRGDPANPLFILNHFLTNPAALPSLAKEANANPGFHELAFQCREESGSIPNFVTVDFYSIGDVFDVVDALNGLGPGDGK